MPLIGFNNSYTSLPERFYAPATAAGASEPWMFAFNEPLARDLGLDVETLKREGAALFSGNLKADDAANVALAYAGHQFGHFVPQLGDGRAMLMGEVKAPDGRRFDIQLKGSGPTRFSRNGDGRAALGPVIREYIVSEAMHALGIPTTRSLAAVVTGDAVYREQTEPGGVLARVAASHIRVGTFQYFAARGDEDGVRLLADHVIARHYPELAHETDRYIRLFEAIAGRQAALIAKWMGVGFIHGVMNTDNMAVSGETIDYGPCAFMDAYSATKTFSSIDRNGRYAYANQPGIGQWNLARLAECLLPLFGDVQDEAMEKANAALKAYGERFQAEWLKVMRAKLGLVREREDDLKLIQSFLTLMEEGQADFTLAFYRLTASAGDPSADGELRAEFSAPDAAQAWLDGWRLYLDGDGVSSDDRKRLMRSANPVFIPRNHRVEEAIRAAVDDGDFSLFEALNRVLARPYEDQPGLERYRTAPLSHEIVPRTFCGT
ncbi:MAG TPA: YdiU family protein [Ensifer sp.]|nr:YdiU family protein [Ensifer sp.]